MTTAPAIVFPPLFAESTAALAGTGAPAQTPRPDSSKASRPQRSTPSTRGDTETWLTDAQGRTYRLEPLPKSQGVKIDDEHVRTLWGVPADLAREDDRFFYIKIYKVAPAVAPKPKAQTPPPPPEPLPRTSQRLRWTPYATGLPTSGQWREGIALADVSKHGRLDIVTSPARKTLRPPAVFVRDETGWKRSSAVKFPPRAYDYGHIAVADLDGDGLPDVVMGVHLRGLIALRNKPGGQFEDISRGLPFEERTGIPVFSSQAIVIADCNGDGKPDILALGEGPRIPTAAKFDYAVSTGIASFVQQADGTWKPVLLADANVFGSSMAAGDIDGDGHIDLVIAPGILGETKILYRGDGACGWQAEQAEAVRPRNYITAVATGKLTGDSRDAVVLGYTDFGTEQVFYGVDLLTRDAEGHWTRKALARERGRGRIEAIAVGDLDGDGKPDVAAVDGDGRVLVMLGDGRGNFTREQQTPASEGHCAGSGIAIGDLDGDGLGDLVVSFAQEASATGPGGCATEGALVAWKTVKGGLVKGGPAKSGSAKDGPAKVSPARRPARPRAAGD